MSIKKPLATVQVHNNENEIETKDDKRLIIWKLYIELNWFHDDSSYDVRVSLYVILNHVTIHVQTYSINFIRHKFTSIDRKNIIFYPISLKKI